MAFPTTAEADAMHSFPSACQAAPPSPRSEPQLHRASSPDFYRLLTLTLGSLGPGREGAVQPLPKVATFVIYFVVV